MKASLGHIGINLSNSDNSFTFWKDLLQYLGFTIIEEGSDHFDAYAGTSYLCVGVTSSKHKEVGFHRKRTGLNHIALNVNSAEQVDQFINEFLEPRKIESLYGGVREYPEYMQGYYAVYFEDPDRIKVEVVYEPQGETAFGEDLHNPEQNEA